MTPHPHDRADLLARHEWGEIRAHLVTSHAHEYPPAACDDSRAEWLDDWHVGFHGDEIDFALWLDLRWLEDQERKPS